MQHYANNSPCLRREPNTSLDRPCLRREPNTSLDRTKICSAPPYTSLDHPYISLDLPNISLDRPCLRREDSIYSGSTLTSRGFSLQSEVGFQH